MVSRLPISGTKLGLDWTKSSLRLAGVPLPRPTQSNAGGDGMLGTSAGNPRKAGLMGTLESGLDQFSASTEPQISALFKIPKSQKSIPKIKIYSSNIELAIDQSYVAKMLTFRVVKPFGGPFASH